LPLSNRFSDSFGARKALVLHVARRRNVAYSDPMRDDGSYKCHFCDECDGHGCVGELPGMGGVYGNDNFIRNCADWAEYPRAPRDDSELPAVRLAPLTGAMQNVGYREERAFYHDLADSALAAGVRLSIGDGAPDEKLRFGIEALAARNVRGAVFIKPYPNERVLERVEWARPVAEIVGVDIDSYAIVTMRNQVNLQRKTAADLNEIRRHAALPFAIKGIFRESDLDLVREVRPDVAVISNHGGRVETDRGSTAAFLAAHGRELRNHCGELWVDGGVRRRSDLETAAFYGVSEVMVGRPFVTALLRHGRGGIARALAALVGSAGARAVAGSVPERF